MQFEHKFIEANGIKIHFVDAGTGPLVLLCHGFPESWYSWRHQIRALSEAGYRVVAPDMRGYGQTDRPHSIEQYSLFHLVGDMVGLALAVSDKPAVVIGHDWGAPIAWHCALFRPDLFRAVAGLSVPYVPRGPVRPTSVMPQTESEIFYQLYFQSEGVAERDFEQDVRRTVRVTLATQPDKDTLQINPMVPKKEGWITSRPVPPVLPKWLTDEDIDFYTAEFERTGFRGGLNWYRNIDRNWELRSAWTNAQVSVPAFYMAGEHDLVLKFAGVDQLIANLKLFVPQLQKATILPDCGHWTQQEKPEQVNKLLIEFLGSLRLN